MFSVILNSLINNWKISLAGLVVVSLLGHNVYLQHEVKEAREGEETAYLQLDSIQAVSDSTREIKNLFADSVRYFERRIVQTKLENDSLDQALNQESRARASIEARIDSLQRVIQSDTVTEDSAQVRTAFFNQYDEPYTINAEVVVPSPPEPASLNLNVKLDPIPMSFRIGCSSSNTNIRSATLGVTTPEWAEVEITEVQEEPGVCNPQVEEPDLNWFQENRGKIGFTLGTVTTILLGISF